MALAREVDMACSFLSRCGLPRHEGPCWHHAGTLQTDQHSLAWLSGQGAWGWR